MCAERSGREARTLRIDKWLWFTRFYKTRSLAAKAVTGGHVRINGQRAKPARDVGIGDQLAIQRGAVLIECTVLGLPERRGAASEAQACYRETDASIERRELRVLEARAASAVLGRPTAGRPDKRTCRLLRDRFRGNRET